MEELRELESLPLFPDHGQPSSWSGLRIDGLVQKPLALSLESLQKLPQKSWTEDFTCEEGWTVSSQAWEGVPLSAALEMASLLPEARHVAISAADFTIGLTLDEAMLPNVLLASRLNGQPLPQEHGGPCRLVAEGKECFDSIKWVDHIQVTASRPVDTAKQIALSRIGKA